VLRCVVLLCALMLGSCAIPPVLEEKEILGETLGCSTTLSDVVMGATISLDNAVAYDVTRLETEKETQVRFKLKEYGDHFGYLAVRSGGTAMLSVSLLQTDGFCSESSPQTIRGIGFACAPVDVERSYGAPSKKLRKDKRLVLEYDRGRSTLVFDFNNSALRGIRVHSVL